MSIKTLQKKLLSNFIIEPYLYHKLLQLSSLNPLLKCIFNNLKSNYQIIFHKTLKYQIVSRHKFLKNHLGHVLYHSREMPSHLRLVISRPMWILWALEGLGDVHFAKVEIVSDCVSAITVILQTSRLSKVSVSVGKNHQIMLGFDVCDVHFVA